MTVTVTAALRRGISSREGETMALLDGHRGRGSRPPLTRCPLLGRPGCMPFHGIAVAVAALIAGSKPPSLVPMCSPPSVLLFLLLPLPNRLGQTPGYRDQASDSFGKSSGPVQNPQLTQVLEFPLSHRPRHYYRFDALIGQNSLKQPSAVFGQAIERNSKAVVQLGFADLGVAREGRDSPDNGGQSLGDSSVRFCFRNISKKD